MKNTDLKKQAERLYKALMEIQQPFHRNSINEHMDFTLPQLRTLMAIAASGCCSMGELGKATGYHLSALTGIIDRLSRKKYVIRVRDKNDRRVVKVALTDVGKKLTGGLYKKIIRQTSDILGRIDSASRENLISLIEKIAINIKTT